MRSRKRLVALAVALVLLVGLVVLLALPRHERLFLGPAPTQFHEQLDPALAKDYAGVLGVAHNAGNRPGTTSTALAHGADVIEIDVVSVRGELVAGRNAPLSWLSDHLFRGPSVTTVWDRVPADRTVKLDLQRNDQALLSDVVAFVGPRATSRPVMISTRSTDAIRYLRPRLPGVRLLLSVPNPDALGHLRSDPSLVRSIDGVSLFQGLVEQTTMTWLHGQHLLVLAWTVNDVHRLNDVVRLGVDGVTTNNLAILEALSGPATATPSATP